MCCLHLNKYIEFNAKNRAKNELQLREYSNGNGIRWRCFSPPNGARLTAAGGLVSWFGDDMDGALSLSLWRSSFRVRQSPSTQWMWVNLIIQIYSRYRNYSTHSEIGRTTTAAGWIGRTKMLCYCSRAVAGE